MPAARASLERLGVDRRRPPVPRHPLPRARPRGRRRCSAAATGLGVRRLALSAALGARADDLGVKRLDSPAGSPLVHADGVEVGGRRARRGSRVADGLHSPLRRAARAARGAARRGRPRYGLRRHYRVRPWGDLVEVHWSPRARGVRDPGRRGRRRRRGARSRRRHAATTELLEQFPELRRAARRARRRRPRCAAPARCGSVPPAGSPAARCWSGTPPATSTPSPARASRSGSRARASSSGAWWRSARRSTSARGCGPPAGTGC